MKMQCVVEEILRSEVNSIGAPKRIEVDMFEWSNHGESGKNYTYHMSSERFERTKKEAYRIQIEENGEKHPVGTLSYYDFVDFSFSDCIGDRSVDGVAKAIQLSSEEIWKAIEETLTPLQEKIREEFSQTEEYQVNKKNQQTIKDYQERKRKFSMEWGVDATKYDRCYNVFGELMDSAYLDKIHQIVRDREKFSENSRRKHKEAWRNFSGSSDFFSSSPSFTVEDQEMLAKFYKVLAKKFHPDANPGVDTSREMQLLNELKKTWGV